MKQTTIPWQPFSVPFSSELHEAILQHHHAAQFLSMAGRQLIPHRDDDSHTSMKYSPGQQLLFGEEINPGVRLYLMLSDLSLGILYNGIPSPYSFTLPGLTRSDAFNKLSHMLHMEGINTDDFHLELHYELSQHSLLHGAPFNEIQSTFNLEHIKYRHNTHLVLQNIRESQPNLEISRIWPHHFDTGTVLPLFSSSSGKMTHSIGMGWAIPDSMVNEPYYYLSAWSVNPLKFPEKLPKPDGGTWMIPHLQGAILPLSEILESSVPGDQEAYTLSFFITGIEILHTLFSKQPSD